MQRCSVWFELDRDHHHHDPGESGEKETVFSASDKIVGTVHVQLETPCPDARLSLSRHWIASGYAPDYRGGADEILLFEGDWAQPGVHRFPFIFHVPPGPYSYHGRLVQVQWALQARLESGGEEIACGERPFKVEASDKAQDYIPGVRPEDIARPTGPVTRAKYAFYWAALLFFSLAGISLIYLSGTDPAQHSWTLLLAGIGSVGLAGYGGRSIFRRHHNAAQSPRPMAPSSSDYEAEPGDAIAFVVELQPNFKTAPHRVSARLTGVEQTYRTRGPGAPKIPHAANDDTPATQIDHHRFYEEAVEIEPLDGASNNSYRVRCRIPSDAPYSFYCPTASVTWAVEVHVDVGSWPDWRRDFPLVVRPNVDAASSPSPTALRS